MPNNRFSHKRTSTSGLLPNTTNSANSAYIAAGELAVNLTDRKIVSSTGSVPFEVGSNVTSLFVGTGQITANATHLKLGSAALFANGSNGTSGQVLTSNGTSAYWATGGGGGGGSPGGSTTQIQFNDAGAFAGSANLTFDKNTNILNVGNTTTNASFTGDSIRAGNSTSNCSIDLTSTISALTLAYNTSNVVILVDSGQQQSRVTLSDGTTFTRLDNDPTNQGFGMDTSNSTYVAAYHHDEVNLRDDAATPTRFRANTTLIHLGNTTVNTRINSTSIAVRALFANNSNGTSGQILFSNATGTYWGNYGIPQNAQTSAYVLALADVGRHISITTGGVTVPNNATVAFSAGDSVTIFNNSTLSQTITAAPGVTMRFAGSTLTGNRTLLNWGLCTVICISSSNFVISGSGLN